MNGVVKRTVYDSTPILIAYSLTKSGEDILKVLDAMVDWGIAHRTETLSNA